ncbi:hypothetical protein EV363DRAFT_829767 [Boletus edulis]|nr:hypothetical protein EV363DRAFT_829767 [Boletus edulis]
MWLNSIGRLTRRNPCSTSNLPPASLCSFRAGWYGNLSLVQGNTISTSDVMQFWMDWHMMDSGKAFLPVDWWVLRLRAERCPGYPDERNQHHHQEVWFTRLTGHRPLSITNSRACISPTGKWFYATSCQGCMSHCTVFASPPKENQNLVYQVHDRLRMNEWIAFNRCIERSLSRTSFFTSQSNRPINPTRLCVLCLAVSRSTHCNAVPSNHDLITVGRCSLHTTPPLAA